MATAKALDKEASEGERPQRSEILPAGAPHSPIMPDVPDTPAQKLALDAERHAPERGNVTPQDGTPGSIPHGDRGLPRKVR